MNLNEAGKAHNTDKASTQVVNGNVSEAHDYLRHYEVTLAPFRDADITVLDLGVGGDPNRFASALAWVSYFSQAKVVAVDIEANTSPHERITFMQMDLGNISSLVSLARQVRPTVVVEDASHWWSHQILSLVYLLPIVEPGGVYIWEDLHTSSPVHPTYNMGYSLTPVDLLDILVDKVCLKDDQRAFSDYPQLGVLAPVIDGLVPLIDSITVLRRSAIFRIKQ